MRARTSGTQNSQNGKECNSFGTVMHLLPSAVPASALPPSIYPPAVDVSLPSLHCWAPSLVAFPRTDGKQQSTREKMQFSAMYRFCLYCCNKLGLPSLDFSWTPRFYWTPSIFSCPSVAEWTYYSVAPRHRGAPSTCGGALCP